MQADTAMPTQSAPQPSATPQPSYGAPVQTAAQQPVVATTPQWVAPQQAAVAPAPQVQAQMGTTQVPYSPYTVKPPEQPISSSSGESIQGRIQPGGRSPEFTSPTPLPGSTVSSDTRVRPGELQFPTSSFIQQSGSADIAAFEREQPGILQQLFPNFAGNQRPATPSKRSKSRKS